MTESAVWHKHFPLAVGEQQPALAQLMQASSLTVALTALQGRFSVQVLHLGDVAWQPHEAGAANLPAAVPLYGREVCLYLNETPVVWARSVCAPSSTRWRTLLDCGTQPLGARLFDGRLPLVRTPFEYAYAQWPDCGVTQPLWMRRSMFDWHGEALLLAEVFLPNAAAVAQSHSDSNGFGK